MKLVYIAGPFRAPSHFEIQKNIMQAMELGLEVAKTPGLFPVIPHSMCMFFTNSAPDSVWLEGDLELLKRCDAVLMVPGWENSFGARAEHGFADVAKMPIFYKIENLRRWNETGEMIFEYKVPGELETTVTEIRRVEFD